MNLTGLLMTFLGLLLGAVIGIGGYVWWLRRQASESLRLPDKWPLVSRVLITNEEYEVLKWLRTTFHDHMVMIKLPVLRFTKPTDLDKNGGGKRWQDLLGGVYCTFTICTANGNVVGCVDVPGKRGISKSARQVKESLLEDCRIAYTLVRSTALPSGSAMRAAFLGEVEVEEQVEHQPTRGGDSSFHADLDSFTRQKRLAAKDAALRELNKGNDVKPEPKTQPAGFNPDGTGSFTTRKPDRFPQQWDDSFIGMDESRPAKLS
ncbi:MAG: DUF2726 domain-containing protein [Polaromonas sp.]|uniref:DUF2726 domain-containing protein n=1 Tax=Polaromonas sp. TaxID=1869339 RepID=UPI0025E75226|nr:DUF2726 domain-containing protein [Polaromonas sp.]MBI2724842.1 DUF2726 domain-containing protein [Polaromonas sp.]